MTSTEQLQRVENNYRLAARQAEQLREKRNQLVRQALAAGMTHAQISEATGLSRGRIGQIAQTQLQEMKR